jgi:predicted RNA-binding protein YlqC (UPF0109 family)
MSDIDQQFIEYVVKSLVGKPDAVQIDRRVDEKGVLLELTVDPDDLGRVIGKRGATAQSLRTLLRALGTKNDARYNLKIMDNGPPRDDQAQNGDDVAAPAGGTDAADDAVTPPADDAVAAADEAPAADSDYTAPADLPAPAAMAETPAAAADIIDDDQTASHEDQTSDRLRQARAELADLDDLDV